MHQHSVELDQGFLAFRRPLNTRCFLCCGQNQSLQLFHKHCTCMVSHMLEQTKKKKIPNIVFKQILLNWNHC